MSFIAESVTTFYDKQEDRLRLIFSGDEDQQVMGLMTRYMLKKILSQLPNWLMQESAGVSAYGKEQEWMINQMDHQVSQQNIIVDYNEIESYEHIETFLIGTVNFSKKEKKNREQIIRLEFLDLNKTIEIIFVLNSAQLHKLIGEILKQVASWDIENPWLDKNVAFIPMKSKNIIMH